MHGLAIRELQLFVSSIEITCTWQAHHGRSVAMLAQIPNLQHLDLSGAGNFFKANSHMHVLKFLPKPVHLRLEFMTKQCWDQTTLAPMKHLICLTSLAIIGSIPSAALMVAPELAQLMQLQQLKLRTWASGKRWTDQDHLFRTISQLTCMTQLILHRMLDSMPADIANLAQLRQLHV